MDDFIADLKKELPELTKDQLEVIGRLYVASGMDLIHDSSLQEQIWDDANRVFPPVPPIPFGNPPVLSNM